MKSGFRKWYQGLVALIVVIGLRAWAQPSTSDATPWLRFDVAPGKGVGIIYSEVNGARFRVDIARDGEEFVTCWSMVNGLFNRWYPMAVDLSAYAGESIRVRLIGESIENRICQDYPYWGDPRVGLGNWDSGKEIAVLDRLALRRPDRVGQILPDGRIVDLTEPALFFGYQGVELVTPGMCSSEHHGMVYGGNSYITVGGKSQPGMYIGFDMSHGFGAGVSENPELIAKYKALYQGETPFHEMLGIDPAFPYLGANIPPVFAEWRVEVPQGGDVTADAAPVKRAEKLPPSSDRDSLPPLGTRREVYRFSPNWEAQMDPVAFTWQVGSGSKFGWGFAALETLGRRQLKLDIDVEGSLEAIGDNAFAGVVIDYHTPLGYQKRVWLGLKKEFAAKRDETRCGSWILDDAALSLRQRLQFKEEYDIIGGGLQTVDLARYAPENWDGRFYLALGLQNVANTVLRMRLLEVKGQVAANPQVPTLKQARASDQDFVILEDNKTAIAVSRRNGALCGAWALNGGPEEAWLAEAADSYKLESFYSISEASELLDTVERIEWLDNRRMLQLTCVNAALPELVITKQYYFGDDGRWFKRVAATLSKDGNGAFFTWINRSALAEDLVRTARRGAGFGKAKRVAQGQVIDDDEDAPPAEQAGLERPAMITKADFSEGIGAYRYRVNDRFVLLGISKYLPNGWELFGFCDYLKAGEQVSGEVAFERYQGDFSNLLLSYQSQREFRALYEQPTPDWMRMLVCDAMYTQPLNQPMAKALYPFTTSSCIWFLAYPWGNYGADHVDPCRNGKYQDPWNITTALRHEAPGNRFSAYHNFLFDEASDIFRDSPWLGVRDREGNLFNSGISSDTTRGASFLLQVANEDVREIMSDMFAKQLAYWGFDYLYFDGPGYGAEVPDWGALDVAQSYDWIEFMRIIHRKIKKLDNDQLIFCNGMLPYSQIGYIEYRDTHWKDLAGPNWQSIAAELWQQKLTEPEGFLRVPTYGHMAAEPAMSAYVLLYGWLGNLAALQRVAPMLAARELHYGVLQRQAVTPDWMRDGGNLEAYAFAKGDLVWLSLLNHVDGPVRVTADVRKLGLTPGRRLFAWRWELPPVDPLRAAPEETPEAQRAEVYRQVMELRPILVPKKATENLDWEWELPAMATNIVFLTHTPVLIAEVDGTPLQMGLSHPDVTMRSRENADGEITVTLVSHSDAVTLALPGIAVTDVVDAKTNLPPPQAGEWQHQPATLLAIGRGHYEFIIR